MKKMKKNMTKISDYLAKVKSQILEVEPDAEVYLFGSRARGDFNEESDWDLLIILPDEITFSRRYLITSKTYNLEHESNQFFNRIYYSREDWLNNKFIKSTPFYKNVQNDAILL